MILILVCGTLLKKKVGRKVIADYPSEGSTPRPRLDIRREMMDADSMLMSDSLEEDDEFETPREHFDSSGKKNCTTT